MSRRLARTDEAYIVLEHHKRYNIPRTLCPPPLGAALTSWKASDGFVRERYNNDAPGTVTALRTGRFAKGSNRIGIFTTTRSTGAVWQCDSGQSASLRLALDPRSLPSAFWHVRAVAAICKCGHSVASSKSVRGCVAVWALQGRGEWI